MRIFFSPYRLFADAACYLTFSLGIIFFTAKFFDYDGFVFERILFFFAAFFLFLIFFISIKKAKWRNFYLLVFSSIFCFLFVFVRFDVFNPTPAIFFISALMLLFCRGVIAAGIADNRNALYVNKNWRKWFWIFIVSCLFLYFINHGEFYQEKNRFLAFGITPTTFATWLIALYIIAYGDKMMSDSVPWKTIFPALVVGYLVYVSGSRINLAFCIFLIFVLFFRRFFFNKSFRIFTVICFILGVFFVYKIYDLLIMEFFGDVLLYRFENDRDDSFNTRAIFFNFIYFELCNSTFVNMLIGHGAEASRSLMAVHLNVTTYPHNDLIRLIYDYGIIFSFGYLLFLIWLGSRNVVSLLFVCLYVVVFLHNMIYSHYLFMLMLIFSVFSSETRNKEMYA